MNEQFSIDNLVTASGYSEKNNKVQQGKGIFEKGLVFPIECKKQVLHWMREHQDELIEYIIRESCKDD